MVGISILRQCNSDMVNPGNPEKDKTSLIQVCLQPGSSVGQRSSNWWQNGLIHAPNLSLEEVVVRITRALESSWGRKGSITFVGWKACDKISQQERNNSINFWISPDADNKSFIGINVRGRDKGTQIKPWGSGGSPTR